MVMFLVLASVVFFGARAAWSASTDSEVQGKMDQMKINVENSEKNRDSYEKNQKIADDNVKALDENLKALSTQRDQIRENVKKADQNVGIMAKQEGQIADLIKKENTTVDTEKKQISDLQSKIDKLNQNIVKRGTNVTEYNAKLELIKKQKTEWEGQKQAAEDLEKAINDKETKATADKTEWKKKAAAYAVEAKKWKTEADENSSLNKKYQKLNN
jgi:chromosome segregation ATPase